MKKSDMINRFTGDQGLRRSKEALAKNSLLASLPDALDQILNVSTIFEVAKSEEIIQQGKSDNDIFFIISGSFAILVNDREVAIRSVGSHVGEMALIDPSAERSASVVARENSVVAKVDEHSFASIANEHPELWRGLAIELSERLRQRNRFMKQPNTTPILFIGCTVESLNIATAIQLGLKHSGIRVKVWTNGLFGPSRFPIEDLEYSVAQADFGLVVLSAEDKVFSRGEEHGAPRDNVVFELGMLIGSLSRNRAFLVQPLGVELKIPTDIMGLTPLTYSIGDDDDLDSNLAPVCEELRREISKKGVK
ncbi:MAG: TIR domain-containing protein [Opitutaceae bacterium]